MTFEFICIELPITEHFLQQPETSLFSIETLFDYLVQS